MTGEAEIGTTIEKQNQGQNQTNKSKNKKEKLKGQLKPEENEHQWTETKSSGKIKKNIRRINVRTITMIE